MKLTAIALAAFMAALTASSRPALAEDTIYVPLFTYRTGPFSGSGIPVANGMHDYLAMLKSAMAGSAV